MAIRDSDSHARFFLEDTFISGALREFNCSVTASQVAWKMSVTSLHVAYLARGSSQVAQEVSQAQHPAVTFNSPR